MVWPASIRTWFAGEEPTAAMLNEQIRDPLLAIGGTWTAYTPVWGSSGTLPAVGNGTIDGAYLYAGKLVMYRWQITSGTTTTYGTGNYTITLPIAGNGLFGYPLGLIMCLTGNPPSSFVTRTAMSTGSSSILAGTGDTGPRWSATSPTPSAGIAAQKFSGYGFYEAA